MAFRASCERSGACRAASVAGSPPSSATSSASVSGIEEQQRPDTTCQSLFGLRQPALPTCARTSNAAVAGTAAHVQALCPQAHALLQQARQLQAASQGLAMSPGAAQRLTSGDLAVLQAQAESSHASSLSMQHLPQDPYPLQSPSSQQHMGGDGMGGLSGGGSPPTGQPYASAPLQVGAHPLQPHRCIWTASCAPPMLCLELAFCPRVQHWPAPLRCQPPVQNFGDFAQVGTKCSSLCSHARLPAMVS